MEIDTENQVLFLHFIVCLFGAVQIPMCKSLIINPWSLIKYTPIFNWETELLAPRGLIHSLSLIPDPLSLIPNCRAQLKSILNNTRFHQSFFNVSFCLPLQLLTQVFMFSFISGKLKTNKNWPCLIHNYWATTWLRIVSR